MRTTAAAASAVTSAAPLVPQPRLEEQKSRMVNDSVEVERSKVIMNDVDDPSKLESASNIARTTQQQEKQNYKIQQQQIQLPTTAGTLASAPSMAPAVPPFPMSTADVLSAYTNAAAVGALDFNVVSGATSVARTPAPAMMPAATAPPFSGHGLGSTTNSSHPFISSSAGSGTSMYHAAGFGTANVDVSASTRRLAKELEEFVERGLEGALAAERGEPGAPSEEAIADLQLQTARRLRQLLPAHRDLLHLVQERDWIPLLLGWLNLHDQPAVQLEALLALTNITELSAQQLYYQHTSSSNGAPVPGTGLMSGNGSGVTSQVASDATVAPTNVANYYSFPPPTSSSPSSSSSSPLSSSLMPGPTSAALAPMPSLAGSGGLPAAPSPYTFSAPVPMHTGAPFAAPSPFPAVTFTPETIVGNNSTGGEDANQVESDAAGSIRGESATVLPPSSISGSAAPFSAGNGIPGLPNAFPAPGVSGSNVTAGFGPFNPQISSANMTSSSSVPFEWDKVNATSAANGNAPGAVGVGGILPPLSNTSFPSNHIPPLPFPSADAVNAAAAAGSFVTAPSPASLMAPLHYGAPSPGSASSSMFLPPAPIPPTTVGGFNGGAPTSTSSIPQPLPASSQHLLLRHADAIPTLISLLSSPNREVHEQAMWILGSIAAGDSSSSASGTGAGASGVGAGAGSGGGAGVASGNGDKASSVAARDVVLAAGVMTPLLRCLEANPQNLSLQRIGSWALSNLVEGQFQQQSGKAGTAANSSTGNNKSNGPGIDYQSSDEIDIKTLLPTLRRLLNTADAEVLSYTCWTLSHLCDGPSSHIAAVVTTTNPTALPGGLVPRLVELLLHLSWRVTKPALRTIGNIVCAECGDDGGASHNHGGEMCPPPTPADYTEVILECDAVPRLKRLITHSNREIQKEACWTLSNIAAGTVDQIQAVIDSGAIPPLVNLVSDKSTDQEVRSEACWVVLNATSCGSDQQIEVLVDEGCVSVLGVLLEEPSMVMMALEGLERVLQVEESREMARKARLAARCTIIDDSDEYAEDEDDKRPPTLVSASLIEKALEKHNSNAVSKRAGRIWKQHFVSCALCRQSFSRHRTSDARFCNECKCHVCSNCDCQVYHLSYQEELWAATEEKTEATKRAKKSKKQKKKEKRKEKKAKQQSQAQQTCPDAPASGPDQHQTPKDMSVARSRSSTVTSSSDNSGSDEQGRSNKPPLNELSVVGSSSSGRKSKKHSALASTSSAPTSLDSTGDRHRTTRKGAKNGRPPRDTGISTSSGKRQGGKNNNPNNLRNNVFPSPPGTDEEDEVIDTGRIRGNDDGDSSRHPPIDFVLYLQQTGSIIALAKLMDALDYGDGSGYDEEIDAELQLLSRQQNQQQHVLSRQATT
uniref:Uncharacterized protein n=1 Tax=Ditylum brightwellii TaxID=49249 RepID=A0A7S4T0S9_9STRA|mmetsp:Transcript_19911/g.26315  ORF Transcript_19911/g.26315 Transcript_19911/m.26315 type:complete len:1380 (+) Transcript_19911:82-4221(+)